MPKTILVEGDSTFKITVPDTASITFGPWSPPKGPADRYDEGGKRGTLRIYDGPKSTTNILAVFSGVKSFRDLSIGFSEQVAREEGATIWKSDEHGYERTERGQVTRAWVDPTVPALTSRHSERAKKAAATRAANKAKASAQGSPATDDLF